MVAKIMEQVPTMDRLIDSSFVRRSLPVKWETGDLQSARRTHFLAVLSLGT